MFSFFHHVPTKLYNWGWTRIVTSEVLHHLLFLRHTFSFTTMTLDTILINILLHWKKQHPKMANRFFIRFIKIHIFFFFLYVHTLSLKRGDSTYFQLQIITKRESLLSYYVVDRIVSRTKKELRKKIIIGKNKIKTHNIIWYIC